MLVILKIPVIYLCCVLYWAIKAEPKPYEGALKTADIEPDPQPGWWWRRRALLGPRRQHGGPHGAPRRTYPRRAAVLASREQKT